MHTNNLLEAIIPKITDDIDITLKKGNISTFLNPFSYFQIRQHLELINHIDHIFIDGSLFAYILKLLKIKIVARKSFDFTSLAKPVFDYAIFNNKSIYFIGSTEEHINGFVQKIKRDFPKMKICGYRNGYFKHKDREFFLPEILKKGPDIIVCGMGTPAQEEMLIYLRNNGWEGTGFTCGGFIHQTSSSKSTKYYPEIINQLELRWVYRIYKEPALMRRYFLTYPKAILYIFLDYIT